MNKEFINKVVKSKKNLIVEGSISSGKTMNVLFPLIEDAIENNESLFIVDSKEEYLNNYYNKLQDENYNIIILNLRDLSKSEGWNPLTIPYNLYKKKESDKAQELVENITKVIYGDDNGNDPFWSSCASDATIATIFGLFEDGKKDEINFNSIYNVFNGFNYSNDDSFTNFLKKKDVNSIAYIYGSATFLAPKETKASILSVVRQKLRSYISKEKLCHFMYKTTFDLDEVRKKPTAIFMITRDEAKEKNEIATMFIEQLFNVLIEDKTDRKFNLVLDNFDSIPYIYLLNNILSSCMARNIKTYIATRNIDELCNIYGGYLSNLCDKIYVYNDNLRCLIGNDEEYEKLTVENIAIKESNIDYPKLKEGKIKALDLNNKYIDEKPKDFVNPFDDNLFDDVVIKKEKKSNKIEKKTDNNVEKKTLNNEEIDELIEKIDRKIEEINLSETIDNEKDNIQSELDQFKI